MVATSELKTAQGQDMQTRQWLLFNYMEMSGPKYILYFSRSMLLNRPFPSLPKSLLQSESKCEIFVMVIRSNFNMNEN